MRPTRSTGMGESHVVISLIFIFIGHFIGISRNMAWPFGWDWGRIFPTCT